MKCIHSRLIPLLQLLLPLPRIISQRYEIRINYLAPDVNRNNKNTRFISSRPVSFVIYPTAKLSLKSILFLVFVLISTRLYAQDAEIKKLLKLDIQELTDVEIISATKTLSKISEVPASVEVIESETIKQNGYLTLEDVLSTLPGFQFRNILGFNSYIFQRGIPNQNNLALLLVDGIEINELNSGGFYAGGQFNLDDVERIEVVYGPASSLYGTNAISGVINIITKEPAGNSGFNISGAAGSFNSYCGNLSYGFYDSEKNYGLRLSAMVKSSDKADLRGSEGDYNWSSDMENFETDYSFQLKAVYKNFKFGLLYQDKQASRTTNYKSTGAEFSDSNTLWNIGFLNIYIKHNHDFSKNINLKTTLAYRNSTVYDNTVAFVTTDYQAGYYRPNRLFSGETMITWLPLSSIKIIGGILLENESLSDDYSVTYSGSAEQKPPTPPAPRMDNINLLSSYIQCQATTFNSVNLYLGGRYDNSSNYGEVFTPRMGIVFNKNKVTLKLLYSEAFRAPKPWDFTNGISNPSLKPEKMNSFEIAASYAISYNMKTQLSLYINRLNDLISQQYFGENYSWINSGEVKTKGMELSFAYQEGLLKSYANYTYNYSIDNTGASLPEIAKHSGNIGLSYEPLADLLLSVRCAYIGKRLNPQIIHTTGNNIIDEALVVDLSASYELFADLTANLTVKNIFDATYYHTSNRPPDRYRQPQRSILFRIDFTF